MSTILPYLFVVVGFAGGYFYRGFVGKPKA